MKRDMDLVREILLVLEDRPFTGTPFKLTAPEKYDPAEVTYHIMLLHEAGLIKAHDSSVDELTVWHPIYITWAGHEFLEAAKDDTRWNQAKSLMKNKGGAMVFEVFKSTLLEMFKLQVIGP